ncbi:hypothetical protein RB25_23970 [Herbaspirillum rubrisubalbicans]|uniref:Uncharacterized protein n=2 Tax=Herbaspirillum rubrisubalbicans TaxID=80842 RepID=A0ABX9BY42_9BURK|nr:hypothetical protein [Herbaspirillum rubrisubalbicans]MCP1573984.1 hypothetical protein [Herbaspirillum rubrisubalbicans]QJQ02527.1 hypothetical protein C798_20555 [Herbaspirillum rubrisubalbicans Os34]RAM62673.1 hypothetical protein RB24_20405 [Herbaspirillum rubrisubalbicans]RAN43168.1 hypothetical protein RB25_23970 [Herbaspirillum rubrisubalbicans]
MENLHQQLVELRNQQDQLRYLAEINLLIASRIARCLMGYLLNCPYGLMSNSTVLQSYADLLRTLRDRGVISADLYSKLISIQEKCDTHMISTMVALPQQQRLDLLTLVEDSLLELDAEFSALLMLLKHDVYCSFQNMQRH